MDYKDTAEIIGTAVLTIFLIIKGWYSITSKSEEYKKRVSNSEDEDDKLLKELKSSVEKITPMINELYNIMHSKKHEMDHIEIKAMLGICPLSSLFQTYRISRGLNFKATNLIPKPR